MKRLPECTVSDREHEAYDQEDEDHDEAHPGKGDEGGKDAAREVDAAPCEVSPMRLMWCQRL